MDEFVLPKHRQILITGYTSINTSDKDYNSICQFIGLSKGTFSVCLGGGGQGFESAL